MDQNEVKRAMQQAACMMSIEDGIAVWGKPKEFIEKPEGAVDAYTSTPWTRLAVFEDGFETIQVRVLEHPDSGFLPYCVDKGTPVEVLSEGSMLDDMLQMLGLLGGQLPSAEEWEELEDAGGILDEVAKRLRYRPLQRAVGRPLTIDHLAQAGGTVLKALGLDKKDHPQLYVEERLEEHGALDLTFKAPRGVLRQGYLTGYNAVGELALAFPSQQAEDMRAMQESMIDRWRKLSEELGEKQRLLRVLLVANDNYTGWPCTLTVERAGYANAQSVWTVASMRETPDDLWYDDDGPFAPDFVDPMDDDTFWDYMKHVDQAALDAGEMFHAVDEVAMCLAATEETTVLMFDEALAHKLYALDGKEWARDPSTGFCMEDDEFLVARLYVVARGKAFYESVLADPSKMPHDKGCEELIYVAERAWLDLFGDDEYMYCPSVEILSGSNEDQW